MNITPETIADIVVKLGIGALSILGMIYVIKDAQKERIANQSALMQYINTNNHDTTDLVKESTRAIVASTEAVRSHTSSIEANTKVMEAMLSSLLNNKE